MSARRNLSLFLPYQIASLEGLSQGLYLVWLLHAKHLRPEVAAVVLSAGSVALTLLEVPTGMLADRVGHRGSLIAGSLAQLVGIAAFWRADSWLGLTAASVAVATGDAFRSGADAALLYESCALLGRPEAFGRIFSRASSAATLALALLTLAGGALADRAGFAVAWCAELALCALGLVIAMGMAPVPVVAPPEDDEPSGTEPPSRFPVTRATLLRLILPGTLASLLFASFELLVQAAWPEGDSLFTLTGIVALAAVAESLGSLLAGGRGQRASLGALAGTGLGVTLVGLAFPVPAFWGLAFLWGWTAPLRAERLQRAARPGQRATLASWAGGLDMATNAIVLPLVAAAFARAVGGRRVG